MRLLQLTVHAYNKRLTVDMHDRDDVSSIFSDEDLGQNREGTHYSGEYMQEKSPPKRPAAGRQRKRSKLSRKESHL